MHTRLYSPLLKVKAYVYITHPQHHTYEENIDVSTDVAAIFELSFHPSQKQTKDCLLDIVMPMNARSQ